MPQPRRKTREEPKPNAVDRAGATGAATAATAATASVVPPAGAVVTAAAIAATLAATIAALRQFFHHRESDDIFWLMGVLRREYPALPESELQRLAETEARYGQEFLRKMEQRLERDIPAALGSSNDPEAALRVVLEREQRYIRQRKQAMLSRSISTQERESLKRASPAGAYWKLSPFVKEHTIDCLVMGEKFWPWPVLDAIHPPRHPNCPCRLYGLGEAVAEGFLPRGFTPPPEEDGIALAHQLRERFSELREAVERVGAAELATLVSEMEDHRLHMVEAYQAKRFAKGTVKGGEFMPKTGGYAAMVSHDLKDAVNGLLSVGKGRGGGPKRPHGVAGRVMHAPTEDSHTSGIPGSNMPGSHGPEAPHRATQPHTSGSPPNWHQFRDRVQSGVQSLAAEHGATTNFKSFDSNPNEPDTSGQRWADGTVELGQAAPGLIEAARQNPEDADAQSGAWLAYSRAGHEAAGHGINPISMADYQTPDGMALEEALAEEVGRDVGHDWLREDGLSGAADWAQANPDAVRAIGAYRLERERLGTILEEAGVKPENRRGVIEAMAYKQQHPARMSLLGGLLAQHQGISQQEARERVRATLAGDRDDDLGLAEQFDAHPLIPILTPSDGSEAPAESTDEGGSPAEPPAASDALPDQRTKPVLDTEAPATGSVPLKAVSGPRGFDARHYSDPRRSLLKKMAALPPKSPGASAADSPDDRLELADGSVIERGPEGSMRFTRPDGESKLYSTPQRLANAETAGTLSRHGITDDRLKKAQGLPGTKPAAMKAPDEGVQDEFNSTTAAQESPAKLPVAPDDLEGDRATSFAEKPPAAVLGIPSYDPEEVGLHDFKAAGGSNGAQMAKDKDGKLWLQKPYKGDVNRVATELLANSIYRELGIDVPDAGQMDVKGKPAVAYPARDGHTEPWSGENQQLGEGFMADALLANWDVVGLEQDNVLWDEEGNPVRLDQGGTLEYRAMGQTKPFGPVPTEAWTMRSPKAGQAFGRYALNDQMLRDQAGDIAQRLTPERVDALVDEAPFRDAKMRERIRNSLKSRVAFMSGIHDGTQELPGPLDGTAADSQHAEDLKRIGGLYPEEETAVGQVLDDASIDDGLRRGEKTPENQKTVEVLDALFKQSRAGEDTALYIPTNMAGLNATDAESLRGRTISDKGYVLGSTDPASADGGKALMRVLVPAGAPALGLGELSSEPGAVMLNRGQQIRIAGASVENGTLMIDAVLTRQYGG